MMPCSAMKINRAPRVRDTGYCVFMRMRRMHDRDREDLQPKRPVIILIAVLNKHV